MHNKASYTAAGSWPAKLFRDLGLVASIAEHGRVLPRHVQLSPTNRCNLKCPFCSCSERNMRDEIPGEELRELLPVLARIGTRAITVTGGGEPALHPQIDDLLLQARDLDIETGLVTNALEVHRISRPALATLTWCRISFSDTRVWDARFSAALAYFSGTAGLAFSYVMTEHPDRAKLEAIVDYAERNSYTHVRVVDDILTPHPQAVEKARKWVGDHPLVIIQPRSSYTVGVKRCLISLLKPMVASDGYIYPCCGLQYALADEQRDFPERMRMGHWRELPDIISDRRHFDGSICYRCFYQGYNDALAALVQRLDHVRFV